jgi:NADH-quinone oxidoreductase subunit M
MLWLYQRAFQGKASEDLKHHMWDLNGREWVAMLPLLILMVWMGTFTQTFMPAISAQNVRILEQTTHGVDVRVAIPAAAQEVARAR